MRVCLTWKATPVSASVAHLLAYSCRQGWFPFLFLLAGLPEPDRVHLPASEVTVFWMGSPGVLVINICGDCSTFQGLSSCQCSLLETEVSWLYTLLSLFPLLLK